MPIRIFGMNFASFEAMHSTCAKTLTDLIAVAVKDFSYLFMTQLVKLSSSLVGILYIAPA